MATLPPTPTLGLVLPDPGTGQQYSRAVENGWWNAVDGGFAADRGRLANLEQFKAGRILLDDFAATNSSGAGAVTGTVTKTGAQVVFNGVSYIVLNNVFKSLYDRYIVEVTLDSASAAAEVYLALRTGTATDAAVQYTHSFREVAPASASNDQSISAPVNAGRAGRAGTGGASIVLEFVNPLIATKRTFWHFTSMDSQSYCRMGSGMFAQAKSFDGFLLSLGGGPTFTGDLRVYGLRD